MIGNKDILTLGFVIANILSDLQEMIYDETINKLDNDEQESLVVSRLAQDIKDENMILFIILFVEEYDMYS